MQFPIRYKLLSIILVILVPFVAISVHHYFEMVEHNKRNTQIRNQAIAEQVAARLDSIIEQSFAALRTLARHPAVIARDSRACDLLFARLLPGFPNHLNILAADMDGNNYGSAVPSATVRRLNYRDKTWFQRGRTGSPVIGDLHVSKLFNIPSVMIALPVMDGDRQVGVLGMPLDLVKVRNSIDLAQPLPPSSTSNVVDSAGNVIVCICEDESIRGRGDECKTVKLAAGISSDRLEGTGADGIVRLYSVAPTKNTAWKVVIGVPAAIAYRNAALAARGYLLVIAAAALIALVLSLLLSRTVSKKVSSLIGALQEVESGNLEVQMPIAGNDELTAVARSFNRMARQRRDAEETSARSSAFLASVLEGIGEGVIVVDRNFRILSANAGYCRQLKLSRENAIGRTCHELSHHRDTPCQAEGEGGCECAVRRCFETGEEQRAVHRHFDQEGNPISIETRAYPLRDEAGSVTAAVETLTDITERQQLEAQLFHSQKMEAIGLLAGGVAHDFNNILTAIIGYTTLLKMRIGAADALRPFVDQIQASAERAAGLTKGLLAFSRKQVLEPAAVRLSEVVGGVEGILRRIIGEDVELAIELGLDERPVQADATQLDQVLMNLCTNARDAMPHGGRLTISTNLAVVDGSAGPKHLSLKDGRYMVLSVTDTGGGMDDAMKEKIFEPFFTTKDLGKGTGLGLSIIYGIVKQHHGAIEVASAPGRGTTFLVYLPVVEGETAAAGVADAQLVTGGSEVILLAEDDEALLSLAVKVLEAHGYRVIPACDGVDAVEKFLDHADIVDLLILDVLMPRMNGKEAFTEIRKHRQDIRTLFMSGYSFDDIRQKGVNADDIPIIPKPFSTASFLRKVRDTLAGGDNAGLPANTN